MAKGIVVDFAGEEVAFDLERVDRDKLCGKKGFRSSMLTATPAPAPG